MSAVHRRFGAVAVNWRSTRSAGLAAFTSETVVRCLFPLTTPQSPRSRIKRSTVHRATVTPWRCNWRHTLRAPYTP